MIKIKKSILIVTSMVFIFILASCTNSVDILFGNYREKTSLNSMVRISKSKDNKKIEIYNNYESEKNTPLITLNSKPTSQKKDGDKIIYSFDSTNKNEPSVELEVITKASSGIKKGQISNFKVNGVTYDLYLDEK